MKIPSHIPRLGLVLPLCLGACTFDGSAPNLGIEDADTSSDARRPDDARVDAQIVDANVPPPSDLHLLLTEVKTTEAGTEFIEIYNPTQQNIALTDYYLSDDRGYAFLPGFHGNGPRPSLSSYDFIAQFPYGSSIGPGEAQVIAIAPNKFFATFGVAPNYTIRGGASDGSKEMHAPFPESIDKDVTLTDDGETITLFFWDGQTDLVLDIDIVIAGANTSNENGLPVKGGREVDGPDLDNSSSIYRPELSTMGNMALPLEAGQSYQRIAPEGSAEVQSGNGNGRYGHDETSENTALTWAIGAATPGTVAGGL